MVPDPSTMVMFRPFLPARDIKVSQQFYADLGFQVTPYGPDLAHLALGSHAFLLQNYYVKEFAENCMMHVLVRGLQSWWEHIESLDLAGRYGVQAPRPPKLEPWGLVVAYVFDPCGVLWHFAEDAAPAAEASSKGE